MSRHPSRWSTLAALGALGALSACAAIGAPGVEIQALQADIVFGVELPPEEDAVKAPAAAGPQPGERAEFDDGTLILPFRNKFADRFNVPFTVSGALAGGDCAKASLGASPSEAAPERVTSLPREGLYRWKRDVNLTRQIQGIDVVSSAQGFELRAVRDVEEAGAGTDPTTDGMQFTYQTVRPDGFGNAVVESFRVNTAPLQRGVNSNVDSEGTSNNVEETAQGAGVPVEIPDAAQESLPNPNTVRVGEPNRGLVLISQELYDANGVAIGSFTPRPPILLLPLPVQPGDTWTSTGVDSITGQVMRVTGVVNERQTVDACGTLVDGWLAELDVTIGDSSDSVQGTTDYVIATGLGAIIIGERTDQEGLSAGSPVKLAARYELAGQDPQPLASDGGNP